LLNILYLNIYLHDIGRFKQYQQIKKDLL